MRLKEIEKRLAEIKTDLEARTAELTAEELEAYETEVKTLQEERTQLLEQQEKRSKLLSSLAGNTADNVSGNNPQNMPSVLQTFGEKR